MLGTEGRKRECRRLSGNVESTAGENAKVIDTLLDACEFILRDQGEPQSSFWLPSQIMETKLWRASEADVRDALKKDIEKYGDRSLFVRAENDDFALRSWGSV